MISSSRRIHTHTRRGLIVSLLRPHFVFLPCSRFIFPVALRNARHFGQHTLPKMVRLNPRRGLPRYEKRILHLAKYSLAHWSFKHKRQWTRSHHHRRHRDSQEPTDSLIEQRRKARKRDRKRNKIYFYIEQTATRIIGFSTDIFRISNRDTFARENILADRCGIDSFIARFAYIREWISSGTDRLAREVSLPWWRRFVSLYSSTPMLVSTVYTSRLLSLLRRSVRDGRARRSDSHLHAMNYKYTAGTHDAL